MKNALVAALGLSLFGLASGQTLEPINKELPSWLRFSGEYRARFEGFSGQSYQKGNDDLYLLNRWRLNVHLQPTKWMKVFAQAQDSRVFWNDRIGNAPPYEDTLDLRLAWAEIGDSDAGTFALRVGRQEINLGEERLLGSSNWGNTARSFDAVRVVGRYRKIRIDAFAASVVAQVNNATNHHVQGDNLHGIISSADYKKTRFEPFVLWRLSPGAQSESGTFGKLNTYSYGLRWSAAINRA